MKKYLEHWRYQRLDITFLNGECITTKIESFDEIGIVIKDEGDNSIKLVPWAGIREIAKS